MKDASEIYYDVSSGTGSVDPFEGSISVRNVSVRNVIVCSGARLTTRAVGRVGC